MPDVVFFLKVSPDQAVERISLRDEELQVHETRDFLKNLQDSYSMVCQILEESEIHYIDTDNKSPESIIDEIVELIN